VFRPHTTRGDRHRRGVAAHEAGHALVCWLVDVTVETVTIRWSGTSHGALVHSGSPSPDSLLRILLAGEAAVARASRHGWFEEAALVEQRLAENPQPKDAGVTSDAESIEAVLEQLHPGDPDAQERALLETREWVEAAVEQHWSQIHLIADALLRETTLSGEEVRRIIETKP
jgi:hypothetical protein